MDVPSPNLVSGVVRVMEESLAAETVSVGGVAGLMPLNFALIVVDPADTVVVKPADGLMATAVALELQVVAGAEVTSWTLLSLNRAVARNCTGTPVGSFGTAGVTTNELVPCAPTVRVEAGLLTTVVPLDRVTVAVTLQLPVVAATLANPFAMDDAIPVGAQAHCVELWLVRSWLLPSL